MEASRCPNDEVEEEEEYVLLDLDSIVGLAHIPPNAPYVLSGLDTLNPMLIIDNKLKLIGEYEETIGTCFVFSESVEETAPISNEESGPSEAAKDVAETAPKSNEESGPSEAAKDVAETAPVSNKESGPSKVVKDVTPIARLHKILKFKLLSEEAT